MELGTGFLDPFGFTWIAKGVGAMNDALTPRETQAGGNPRRPKRGGGRSGGSGSGETKDGRTKGDGKGGKSSDTDTSAATSTDLAADLAADFAAVPTVPTTSTGVDSTTLALGGVALLLVGAVGLSLARKG